MNTDTTTDNPASSGQNGLTYRDAGVDIDAGEELVQRIKPDIAATHRPGVLGTIGGFGGLFELPWDKYRAPVMVSGTDGVGTKLMLASRHQRFDTIGIDLVGMCVNDIIVTGAEPLVFLDYFATGKLDTALAATVIGGIANGCQQAGAALVGGETAEMPGLYDGEEFDLAGFAVGLVEKDQIIDGSQVKAGDSIIGLASSGPHSNGFSLINKLIETTAAASGEQWQSTLDELMQPTRIYVKSILSVLDNSRQNGVTPIKAMAHITGGGLLENIPRVLPAGVDAVIDCSSWQRQHAFQWIRQHGNVATAEMYRVFNCGIGMAIIVNSEHADDCIKAFNEAGETAILIGQTVSSADGKPSPSVILQGQEAF